MENYKQGESILLQKIEVDRILPGYPLRTYKAIYDMELTSVYA